MDGSGSLCLPSLLLLLPLLEDFIVLDLTSVSLDLIAR